MKGDDGIYRSVCFRCGRYMIRVSTKNWKLVDSPPDNIAISSD